MNGCVSENYAEILDLYNDTFPFINNLCIKQIIRSDKNENLVTLIQYLKLEDWSYVYPTNSAEDKWEVFLHKFYIP